MDNDDPFDAYEQLPPPRCDTGRMADPDQQRKDRIEMGDAV